MKKNSLRVALLMDKLTIAAKIIKARLIVDAITNNASVFVTPNPPLATVTLAIKELSNAYDDTADGGKSKTAIMHDKEAVLMNLLHKIANYVEDVANDDEAIVHLATLDVKKKVIVKNTAEFEVFQWNDRGAVGLKVKARKKTIYKWQYCKSPLESNTWVDAITTDVAHATIGDLEIGSYYYFRVVFIDGTSEHLSKVLGFAVN